MGYIVQIRICTDSQAARASVAKLGFQRVKHIQLRLLYIGELLQSGAVSLQRIPGDRNSADCLTNVVSGETLRICVMLLGGITLEDSGTFVDRGRRNSLY